ncbi:2843_t:CDS:2, partial [Ambispora gerdemannii]
SEEWENFFNGLRKEFEQAVIREAKFMLANCYMQEIGTSFDPELGFRYFKEASDRGHLDSKCRLGYCYMTGVGITEDKLKAFKFWYDAAMLGSSIAQNDLAYCYCFGEAAEKDLHQTIRWLRKAINSNDGESMETLKNVFK